MAVLTVSKVVGDVTVAVSKVVHSDNAGERLEAFLKFLASKMPVDPGYGVEAPPKPDQGLPGQPPKPDQGLPPSGSPGTPTHPIAPGGEYPSNELPGFIAANAKEIAKAILKGTMCDMDKPQPK